MRRAALAATLSNLPDDEAVRLMASVARAGRAAPEAELAMLVLAAVIEREDQEERAEEERRAALGPRWRCAPGKPEPAPYTLGYQRRVALYQEAKRSGDELVARLLLTSGRQPGTSRPVLGDPIVEPSKPLGYRKAQARTTQRRDEIERLLQDPDATVLRVLLQNPRCTSRDAVNLAARRPTTPEAQREVHGSRFTAVYDVRLALAHNPYTPVDLSARLLPGLLRSDVQQVRRSLELAPALRAAADEVLKARA